MLAAAAAVLLLAADPAAAQPQADACPVSAEERALVKLTTSRMVRGFDPDDMPIIESLIPATGCGVWRVTVAKDGTITRLDLARAEVLGPYEQMLRPALLKVTYRPSATGWSGLMKITFREPE